MSFIGQYVLALAVVGLMLVGLYAVVRALGRGRIVAAAQKRLVSVVESTFIAQNTTVHVLKAGGRYFLVGGGSGHVNTLAELAADEVEPWLAQQRQIFGEQTRSLSGILKQFRLPGR